MRRIIYKCDNCGREYPYELQADDKDRGVLFKVFNKEYCRKCLTNAILNINNK